MIGDRDSGVSVVIAFVTILAIIAIAVGMWALLGIPGQIREANEAHAVAVTDAMIDYKVMLDNLHKNNFTSLNVSVLLPVGSSVSSFSSGQIALKSEKAGTLSLVKNDNYIVPVWSQDVNRFVLTTGTAEIGYEGGGVYRGETG
ncbi:MAG: hypothetical protein Q4Q53_06795, partial [Methanocorpusculum sp.]|nr:hypothetical protein [Methanocorpusculum sp.]